MVTVNIPTEYLDEVIRSELVNDYRGICEEIRRLEILRATRPLESFEHEDLVNDYRFKYGFEAIFRYYMLEGERRELIDEENRKIDESRGPHYGIVDELEEDLYDDIVDFDPPPTHPEMIDLEGKIDAVDEKTNILRKQLDELERMFASHIEGQGHATGRYHSPAVRVHIKSPEFNG